MIKISVISSTHLNRTHLTPKPEISAPHAVNHIILVGMLKKCHTNLIMSSVCMKSWTTLRHIARAESTQKPQRQTECVYCLFMKLRLTPSLSRDGPHMGKQKPQGLELFTSLVQPVLLARLSKTST